MFPVNCIKFHIIVGLLGYWFIGNEKRLRLHNNLNLHVNDGSCHLRLQTHNNKQEGTVYKSCVIWNKVTCGK